HEPLGGGRIGQHGTDRVRYNLFRQGADELPVDGGREAPVGQGGEFPEDLRVSGGDERRRSGGVDVGIRKEGPGRGGGVGDPHSVHQHRGHRRRVTVHAGRSGHHHQRGAGAVSQKAGEIRDGARPYGDDGKAPGLKVKGEAAQGVPVRMRGRFGRQDAGFHGDARRAARPFDQAPRSLVRPLVRDEPRPSKAPLGQEGTRLLGAAPAVHQRFQGEPVAAAAGACDVEPGHVLKAHRRLSCQLFQDLHFLKPRRRAPPAGPAAHRWPYFSLYALWARWTSSSGRGWGRPRSMARWTVFATSSTITAAFSAAWTSGPMAKTPWLLRRIAGDDPMWSTTAFPISSPPTGAYGPHGIGPPNSSAMAVRTTGIGSPKAAKLVAYGEWVWMMPFTSGRWR